MNLEATISLLAGGPGSGCNPAVGKCGRTIVLYHGTAIKNLSSIQKNGLQRYNAAMAVNRKTVSLTSDRTMAKQYGFVNQNSEGKYAVLRLELPREFVHRNSIRDSAEKRSRLFLKDVPAKYIMRTKIHDGKNISKVDYKKLWKH